MLSIDYSGWVELIKGHEGWRSHKYEDSLGFSTIGYGHLIQGHEDYDVITKEFGESLLHKDFGKAIAAIRRMYPNIPDTQLFALAHFVYAKGIGNYQRSKLRVEIEKGSHRDRIYREWIDWAVVKGKYNKISIRNRCLEYFVFIKTFKCGEEDTNKWWRHY